MLIERYIQEQRRLIGRSLVAPSLHALSGSIEAGLDHLVMIGSGSSFNALAIVQSYARQVRGWRVDVVNPTDFLLHDTGAGGALAIVLSQSGRSTTSVEAVRRAQAAGLDTLVLTADPDSPIARLPGPAVLLDIGEESIGPKTKGFTASVAAGFAVIAALAGTELPSLAEGAVATLLGSSKSRAQALVEELGVPDYIVVGGNGRHFGVALEATLKIAEIAGVPTAGFTIEELLHGRLHAMGERSLGIVITGSEAESAMLERVARVMSQKGVDLRIVNASARPTQYDWMTLSGWPVPLDAIGTSIPFQELAVKLALRKGMDPDVMAYPGLSGDLAIKVV